MAEDQVRAERGLPDRRIRAVRCDAWSCRPTSPGSRKGKKLVYVGGVGTGFKHKEARDLKTLLDKIPAEKPPVTLRRKNAVFARPTYVAEIEFRGSTDDQKLRHASFKGIREPEDNRRGLRYVGFGSRQ